MLTLLLLRLNVASSEGGKLFVVFSVLALAILLANDLLNIGLASDGSSDDGPVLFDCCLLLTFAVVGVTAVCRVVVGVAVVKLFF